MEERLESLKHLGGYFGNDFSCQLTIHYNGSKSIFGNGQNVEIDIPPTITKVKWNKGDGNLFKALENVAGSASLWQLLKFENRTYFEDYPAQGRKAEVKTNYISDLQTTLESRKNSQAMLHLHK